MNSAVPQSSRTRLGTEQIRGLLIHVDAEEVALRNAMGLLQDLPLNANDDSRHRDLRLRIEQSLNHIALLSQNRFRVLRELAGRVGLKTEDISFSALLPFADRQAASSLISARQRLQRLVVQIAGLVSTAAWIIGESRRIHQTILDALPGYQSSDRYDSTGQRSLSSTALRFETRS